MMSKRLIAWFDGPEWEKWNRRIGVAALLGITLLLVWLFFASVEESVDWDMLIQL